MRRIDRLRERSRFQEVRRDGRCWSERYLVLCVLPNGLAWNRYGFSASKRIGKAVKRNRARRRMREVIRLRQAQILQGWDLVLIARPAIVEAEYRQIEAACHRLLGRAGLLQLQPTISGSLSQEPRP